MKNRSEYLRPESLAAVRRETANFKRFKKLVDRWAALALQLSQTQVTPGTAYAARMMWRKSVLSSMIVHLPHPSGHQGCVYG